MPPPTPLVVAILQSLYLTLAKNGRCRVALLALLRAHPIPNYVLSNPPLKRGWPFSPPSSFPGLPLGGGRMFGRLVRTILHGTVDEVREVLFQCHSNSGLLLSFKPKGPFGGLCLVPLDAPPSNPIKPPPSQPFNEAPTCARVNINPLCPSSPLSFPPSSPCAPPVRPIFYPRSLPTMPLKTRKDGGITKGALAPSPLIAAADVDPILYPLLASLPMPPPLSPSTQSYLSSLIHSSGGNNTFPSSPSSLPPPRALSQHELSSVMRALRVSITTGSSDSISSRGTTAAHKPKANHPPHPLAPGYRSPDMFRGTIGTARVSRLPSLHPTPKHPQWRSGDALLPTRPTTTTTTPTSTSGVSTQVPWGASVHGAILHPTQSRGGEELPDLILAGDARRTVAALKRAREGDPRSAKNGPGGEGGGNQQAPFFLTSSSSSSSPLDGVYSSSGSSDPPGLESRGGEWGVGGSSVSGATGSASSLVSAQVALQHNTREAMGTLEAFLLAVDRRVVPSLQSLALAGGVEGGRKRREILASIKHTVVASERALWEGGRGEEGGSA